MGILSRKSNSEMLKEKRDVDGLIEVLRDIDHDVQTKAFRSLSMARSVSTAEQLMKSFRKDIFGVREEAAQALGEIKDNRAVEPLIKAVKDEDEFVEVRASAALALGDIKDKRAVEPLIETLERPAVAKPVAYALGEIGDERGVEPLKKLLKLLEDLGGYQHICKVAKEALEKIQKKQG